MASLDPVPALETAILRAKQLAGAAHPATYRKLAEALDLAEREGQGHSAELRKEAMSSAHDRPFLGFGVHLTFHVTDGKERTTMLLDELWDRLVKLRPDERLEIEGAGFVTLAK